MHRMLALLLLLFTLAALTTSVSTAGWRSVRKGLSDKQLLSHEHESIALSAKFTKEGTTIAVIRPLIEHLATATTDDAPYIVDLLEHLIWAMHENEFKQYIKELLNLRGAAGIQYDAGDRILFIIQFRSSMLHDAYHFRDNAPLNFHSNPRYFASPLTAESANVRPMEDLLRAVANFVGDSFLGGVSTAYGRELEGGKVGDGFQFLSELVEAAGAKLTDIKIDFDILHRQCRVGGLVGQAAMLGGTNYPSYISYTARIVSLILEHDLPTMGAVVIPCGWMGEKSGHAMTLEITAQGSMSFRVRLFNAGAGLQFHSARQHHDRINYIPVLEFQDVPRENIVNSDFILHLLQTLSFADQSDSSTVYQHLMSPLLPFMKADVLLRDEMAVRQQQSGTCWVKSPKMFLLGHVNYDRAKFSALRHELEMVAIDAALKRIEADALIVYDATWRRVLVETRANLARRVLKKPINHEPTHVEGMINRIEQVIKDMDKRSEWNEAVMVDMSEPPNFRCSVKLVRRSLAVNESPTMKFVDLQSANDPWMARLNGEQARGRDLVDHVREMANSGATCSIVNLNLLVDAVLQLPMPPTTKFSAWGAIDTRLLAQDALDQFDLLTDTFDTCHPYRERLSHFDRTVAMAQVLAISWNLAAYLDELEQLYSYTLDSTGIEVFLRGKFAVVYDDALNTRADELLSYFASPFGTRVEHQNRIYDSSIIHSQVGCHHRHYGTFAQQTSWEVEDPNDKTKFMRDHSNALKGTTQSGFLRLLSTRADMILERQKYPEYHLSDENKAKLTKRDADNGVECSTKKNLVWLLAGWERLPFGSLHFMRPVHRAYMAFNMFGSSVKNKLGVVLKEPLMLARNATDPLHNIVDKCLTSVVYMSGDHYFNEPLNWYRLQLDKQQYGEGEYGASHFADLLFRADHNGAMMPHFGRIEDAADTFSTEGVETLVGTNEGDHSVMQMKKPIKLGQLDKPWVSTWLQILAVPIGSSMPRLLYEWRIGLIDVDDPMQQPLIDMALFRRIRPEGLPSLAGRAGDVQIDTRKHQRSDRGGARRSR